MAAPATFREKINSFYRTTALAISSEGPVADHDKRLNIVKQMANGGGSVDWFVTGYFSADKEFGDATPLSSFNAEAGTLMTVLTNLGFGG